MILFPAIDLYDGKAVRLFKGNYAQMTVYSAHPESVAADFVRCGAGHIHIVDLQGAKDGTTPNFEAVQRIKAASGAFCEIGGGIRSMEVIRRYLDAGLDRVILGTAAVTDRAFLKKAVDAYGEKIAVGVDLKDGYVAVKGWTETTAESAEGFCAAMREEGVGTLIITDISRDGAMQGTNLALYRDLSARFDLNITASGGVSGLEDVRRLREMALYGAIIGKAYYTGAINLREAIEAAK